MRPGALEPEVQLVFYTLTSASPFGASRLSDALLVMHESTHSASSGVLLRRMLIVAEGRGRKRPFASHLPSFDEDVSEAVSSADGGDVSSPAHQRRRSSAGQQCL